MSSKLLTSDQFVWGCKLCVAGSAKHPNLRELRGNCTGPFDPSVAARGLRWGERDDEEIFGPDHEPVVIPRVRISAKHMLGNYSGALEGVYFESCPVRYFDDDSPCFEQPAWLVEAFNAAGAMSMELRLDDVLPDASPEMRQIALRVFAAQRRRAIKEAEGRG